MAGCLNPSTSVMAFGGSISVTGGTTACTNTILSCSPGQTNVFGAIMLVVLLAAPPAPADPLRKLDFEEVDAYAPAVSDTIFGPRLSWSRLLLPGWDLRRRGTRAELADLRG